MSCKSNSTVHKQPIVFRFPHSKRVAKKMGSVSPTHTHLGVRVGALGEPGVLERLLAADDAVPEAVVEPAVVLAVDVSLRGEPPDLGREPGGEAAGVEAVDGADPALALQEPVVEGAHVVPEHGHQPHPRDHHPFPRVRLPPRRRLSGGRRRADGRPRASAAACGGGGRGQAEPEGVCGRLHGGDGAAAGEWGVRRGAAVMAVK
jgi:hypothetical protein